MSDEVFQHQLQSFGPLLRRAARPAVVRWLQERPERLPRLQAWLQDHLRSQGP